MQALPTEAKPLPACSQCGTALAPPSGSATFVYGVGAVGYQSCDTCGAKWRYLWQDPPGAGGGLNRLPFLLVGASIVVLIGIGAFALLRSSTDYKPSSAAGATTTPTTTHGTTTSTTSPVPASTGADFSQIVTPVADARSPLMQYLLTTALSSAQYEVNTRVQTFVNQASQSVNALQKARWPTVAADDVHRLVAADQQFISDLDLVPNGLLYSTSFTDKLTADVGTINRYETAARSKLGLSS